MYDEAMTPRPAGDHLTEIQARAAELQRRIDDAPDENTARTAADELHALMDDMDNVAELPHRSPA